MHLENELTCTDRFAGCYRKIAEIASRKAAFADETLRESGGAAAASGSDGGRESPTVGLKDVLSEALAGVLD